MALDDSSNLVGLADLINPEFVDPEVDLSKIEKLLTDADEFDVIEEDEQEEDPLAEYMEEDNDDDDNEQELEEDNESVEESTNLNENQIENGLNSFSDINDDSSGNINFDPDDDAIIMIEEIDELYEELEETYPTIRKKFEHINEHSDPKKIKETLKYLRLRYERIRSHALGKELILSMAHVLEFLFDGKRKYGPFTPDLTGWSNTIRPKVRRLQYETATIISEVMNDYKLGPWVRLGIELIPSAVLYSRSRKEQYGQKGYTPSQMSEAYDDLVQLS